MPLDDPKDEPISPPGPQDTDDADARADGPGMPPTQHMRRLNTSALGSGLLAEQPTPEPEEAVAVAKVCPQCGAEYETGSRFCLNDGTALRPKTGADPMIGRVIAERYLILARLGEGGMGRVYLAEHVRMNRQCAVKVMNPMLVNDSESAARFAREASSAARIIHPNVAAVFDFGETDKIVYLVMEYVDGEPLSRILAGEGALEPRRAVELARQIADGLAAAHEIGIVHRDLKPDNIIVAHGRGGRETPKIVDFGIAKALSESAGEGLTRSGLVIGTPEYMSPEQLLGDPVDARSDVYSLGCILFYVLTGTPAFAADSREQMIRRRLREAPPHVRDINPGLPRRLDTIIAHMLARAPNERLGSAAEARDALDPALSLAEWTPPNATMLRPTPRSLPTETMARIAEEIALQPTMPIARQRVSLRRVLTATALGLVVLLAAIELWPGKAPPVAPAPVQSAPPPVAADTQPQPMPAGTAAPTGTAARTPVVSQPPARTGSTTSRVPHDTMVIGGNEAQPASRAVAALHAPLERFTRALQSGSVPALLAAYPGMPSDQQELWRKFFAGTEDIEATATYGPADVKGDRATLDYSVKIRFTSPASRSRTDSPVSRYHAVLARSKGRWQIVELQPK